MGMTESEYNDPKNNKKGELLFLTDCKTCARSRGKIPTTWDLSILTQYGKITRDYQIIDMWKMEQFARNHDVDPIELQGHGFCSGFSSEIVFRFNKIEDVPIAYKRALKMNQ
jgi:hypothetical protein